MKVKTFDAVAASRKWREDTGRRLDAMSIEERLAFFNSLQKRNQTTEDAPTSSDVREDAVTVA